VDWKGVALPGFITYPKGTTSNGSAYWANILTDNGYVPAPIVQNVGGKNNNGAGAPGPRTNRNPYFCPAGEADLRDTLAGGNNQSLPASRLDGHADYGYRLPNGDGDSVDVWYGCNSGADSLSYNGIDSNHAGPPLHRYSDPPANGWITTSMIRHSADVVLFYDGILDSLFNKPTQSNPNRLSARHNRKTSTNMAFADGHAATFDTRSLPGGLGLDANNNPYGGAKMCTFYDPTYLQQNYPPPAPQWRLETLGD
jgi:prepilin-type processing-associated H-X9-DG protein